MEKLSPCDHYSPYIQFFGGVNVLKFRWSNQRIWWQVSKFQSLEQQLIQMESQRKKELLLIQTLQVATIGCINDIGQGENMDGVHVDDDLNDPTMGERLASLNLLENGKNETHEEQEKEGSSPRTKAPIADSVNVLLNQALHADDRALLLDCLYSQDDKVIANSVSQLNSSNVLKLLQSLISVIQSRGAALACALPWIKSLLLQHAGGIMSQESSLLALNSLYQLIESRVATFESALQISSCLDLLYAGIVEDELDENGTIPVIFEDGSDKQESEDAMESDEAFDGIIDFEGIGDMSD
ncbi:hypothetical protein DITRI_Ditri16bG0094100 [Diplodiscus trichospermus]